jgi:1,4-alpha-glucan branching enzyme
MNMDSIALNIQQGQYHDPFEYLGRTIDTAGNTIIRAFLPAAESVDIDDVGHMQRIEGTDIFECHVPAQIEIPEHYQLVWREKNSNRLHKTISPYSFLPQVGDLDIYLFAAGKHHHAWHFLGAHLKIIDGIKGCQFAVWAPHVKRVSIIGDFNGWDGRRHPMRCRGQSGIWELFIPGLQTNDVYKYEILSAHDTLVTKTDPYARQMAMRPDTTSLISAQENYRWEDSQWMRERRHFEWQHKPISIYEMHAGSWKRRTHLHSKGDFLNWRVLARELIPYLQALNYTHVELLPVAEHPLDESWGYQVSGYYAPTARHGSPDDFRYFVDQCHQNNIGVILDWVPAHFPKDDFALAQFTGEPLYEHADPRRGEHQDWGTLIFDYGRNEVRNFLIANAVYWLEDFHIDGLRVDAVASMLYLDYSRNEGEWLPNEHGGRENLDAIDFLKELNTVVHQRFPGALTIAEESTSWPMVSRPVDIGGLGFSMKWNMGWMNDNLAYIEKDPVHRQHHHNNLTFSMMYAWTENFVLPLSHDEVVHLKKSMLSKMPGDYWQKMANLRLFYAWQYAHPGKKLLFMGGEMGQWDEWNSSKSLDWDLLGFESHAGIHRLLGDLNKLYREKPALHQYDFDAQGFQWLDCNDHEQSILSLLRQGEEGNVICVLNFTPVPREAYRVGVPASGQYQVLLNSDSTYYSGSDYGNAGLLNTESVAWMGFDQSIHLRLPPLGAVFLEQIQS